LLGSFAGLFAVAGRWGLSEGHWLTWVMLGVMFVGFIARCVVYFRNKTDAAHDGAAPSPSMSCPRCGSASRSDFCRHCKEWIA
jgi:hypothetical protein